MLLIVSIGRRQNGQPGSAARSRHPNPDGKSREGKSLFLAMTGPDPRHRRRDLNPRPSDYKPRDIVPSCIVSDAVQNLRSALDTAVCAVAVSNGKSNPKSVAFPFASSADQFEKSALGRCKTYRSTFSHSFEHINHTREDMTCSGHLTTSATGASIRYWSLSDLSFKVEIFAEKATVPSKSPRSHLGPRQERGCVCSVHNRRGTTLPYGFYRSRCF